MSAHTGYMAGQVALQLQDTTIAEPTFLNALGNRQGRWKELTYEELAQALERGTALEAGFGDIASDNPDLSVFKARGSEFLSWHGWNDEAIPAQRTIQYYNEVVERMGGREAVQNFFKLYMVAGWRAHVAARNLEPHSQSSCRCAGSILLAARRLGREGRRARSGDDCLTKRHPNFQERTDFSLSDESGL